MKRFPLCIITFLVSLLTMAATGVDIEEQLKQFDNANKTQRIAIANTLFKNHLAPDTVLHFNNNVNPDYLEAMVTYWAAEYYYSKSKYDRAAIYMNRSLPLQRSTCNEQELADGFNLLGMAYIRMGDFATAIKYQEECLKLDQKSGDKTLISSSLNNIAATCLTAGQASQGEKYITEAINIERTLNRPESLSIRLGMASEIYLRLNKLDKAMEMAQEALSVEETSGNPNKVPVRKSQLAAVFDAMGKQQQAMKLLLQAEEGLRKTDNLNSLAIVLNQLGNIEVKQGNMTAAARHLRESVELCETTGNQSIELKARRMLCVALRNTNPAEALVELEKYAELKDSVYSTNAAQSLTLFNVKYETAEKEHNIDILKQQVKYNHLWMGILGIILVTALIVSALMWRMARVKEAKNKTLIKANLLKDELLEIAQKQREYNDNNHEKIVQLAHKMGSMGEMPEVKITRREREIMVLCCEGLLAKEIAEKLNISQRTVETHKTNLFKKLGINNTIELIRYAQAIGAVHEKTA